MANSLRSWPTETMCCEGDIELQCSNDSTIYEIELFSTSCSDMYQNPDFIQFRFIYNDVYTLASVDTALSIHVYLNRKFSDIYNSGFLDECIDFDNFYTELKCKKCGKVLLTNQNIKDIKNFFKPEFSENYQSLVFSYCKEIGFNFKGI